MGIQSFIGSLLSSSWPVWTCSDSQLTKRANWGSRSCESLWPRLWSISVWSITCSPVCLSRVYTFERSTAGKSSRVCLSLLGLGWDTSVKVLRGVVAGELEAELTGTVVTDGFFLLNRLLSDDLRLESELLLELVSTCVRAPPSELVLSVRKIPMTTDWTRNGQKLRICLRVRR